MIVVTGAAGFIGSNIVYGLNRQGRNDLAICDWLGSDGRWRNLRHAQFREFVFPEALLAQLDRLKPEAIVHMGADSSTTSTDGDAVMRMNFLSTLALLDWATANAVPFIYASSAATYGDGRFGFDDCFSTSALSALRPLNLYGWSKHQIDLIVAERAEKGLALPPKCIGLKFFNVYGPNEYHKQAMMSLVAKNFELARDGREVSLFKSHRPDYADGGQLRDFIHVDDIVSVVLWFLDPANGPDVGVFNVGTGRASSFAALTEALFRSCGQEPLITYIPMPENIRDQYQYFTEASLANLRAAGYDHAFLTVEEGVERYVRVLAGEDRYL